MKKILIILVAIVLSGGCQNIAEEREGEAVTEERSTITGNILYERYRDIELIAKLQGHSGKLWSLAAGGGTLVSGGEKGKLIIWDMETLSPLLTDNSHSSYIKHISITQDGNILSAGRDRTLREFSLEEKRSRFVYNENIDRFTINRESSLIAIYLKSGNIEICRYDNLKKVSEITPTDGCFELRFHPDKNYLFTVGHNGKVQEWDIDGGELRREYEGLSLDVHCLDITDDGRYIAAGSIDRYVMVWNTETGERISRYSHRDGLYDLDISSDGKIIASAGCDKFLTLVELKTGKVLKKLRHSDEIHAVVIDPDCRYIAAGGYDSDLYVWGITGLDYSDLPEITPENAALTDQLNTMSVHSGVVFDTAISNNETMIASGSRDNSIIIWDTGTGAVLKKLETEGTTVKLLFTDNDKYLISQGEMGNLRIWETAEGTCIYESGNSGMVITGFDLSSDNRLMAAGGLHGEVRILDFKKRTVIREKTYSNFPVMNIEFTPDDNMICFTYAGQTEDFSLHVVTAENLDPVFRTGGHAGYNYDIAFAPEKKLIATAGADNLIKFWNMEDGAYIKTLSGHRGKVMDIEFSGDESLLVSGSAHDQTLRIWNTSTGEELRKIFPGDEVQCVDISPKGGFFISSGEDGVIRIWGIGKD